MEGLRSGCILAHIRTDVHTVIVNGQVVLRDRELIQFADEVTVMEEATARASIGQGSPITCSLTGESEFKRRRS